ncbi:GGDEF domain-containing protein [Pseudomonas mangiferae]|uniref:diguanylate cyclase n=1 Tax=Pseudomonas mangiferae TaxID=2593654 RepID=A0A553GYN5_9PSED|nr:sensor domain-containing diguanylate cyclase [Pseudomonas mangiferae]TRX74611.1 sensor domain-containing diguanylate cyclase [Pseudomonas mangiferae]
MDDSPQAPSELEQLTLALLHSRAEAERLREREQLFSTLLGSVNAVLWAFDWNAGQIIYVSPAYETVFGRSAALLLADYDEWRNSIYPDDMEYAAQSFAEVFARGSVETREYRIIRGDGQIRWLSDKCFVSPYDDSQPPIVVGIAEDITEKKRMEGELHRLATLDVLTQSSNRRYFFECAEREYEVARRNGSALAFLLLDVDDFKKVNDTYGHQVGDQVLQRVAQCAASALRRADLFGRIGGEEFAAVLPGCDPQQARQIAERLQREVQRQTFNAEGATFGVTLSQGLTTLRSSDRDLDALYSRADEGMYRAKRQGKNQVVDN